MFLKQRWLVLSLAALLLGLVSLQIQIRAAHPVQLDESVAKFQRHDVVFEVLENPREMQGRFTAAISLRQVRTQEILMMNARGLLSGDVSISSIHRGETFSCTMQFRPAHKPTRDGFVGSCGQNLTLVSEAPKYLDVFTSIRTAFVSHLCGVSTDAAGLVAGLAIGDTSQVSDALVADMKSVSLTHLTAVSGANCAIVVALIYFLLKRFGARRAVRTFAAMASLVGYVLLVGAQPSVLRSAVMAAAVLIGAGLGRKTAPLNALALAILVLLIADPWLAVDFGFALSVFATLGLLMLTQPLTAWLEQYLPKWMALSIAVAASAQLFCLPILLQLQGGLSTYSLPANILAEPLVAPITVLGILACIFASTLPGVATVLSWLASIFAWCITRIAQGFTELPSTTIVWFAGITGLLVSVALIFAVLIFFKARSAATKTATALAIAAIFAITISMIGARSVRSLAWPVANWQIVNCDVGQGDALILRSDSRVAVIDVGPEDKLMDACLNRLGIQNIDLLVLTHFDMDHIGGLGGAIGGRVIGTAMVSSFVDERWGALGALKQLRASGVTVVAAQAGYTGNLGSIQFQVLNPSGAPEDSNDGSLVICWRAQRFVLLTMADLGERGQMRLASQLSTWRGSGSQLPLVLKVSHHGSADQYPELIEALHPRLSLISVGAKNSYGHPTQRTLALLNRMGSTILRTDQQGAISVAVSGDGLNYSVAGAG